MGWIWLLVCVGAVFLNTGSALFIPSIVVAVGNLWSFGIMHNFRHEPQTAPNGATLINMLTTVAGIVLLIVGLL